MRSPILAAVVAAVLVAPAAPAAEDPIDKLISDYVTARDEADKAVKGAAAKKSILAEAAAALNKKLADLGIAVPVPVPPIPVPPTDPLVTKFKVAYAAETAADKASAAADLGELCKQAADMAGDVSLTTVGGLAAKASAAGKTLMHGRLVGVFAVFKAEVSAAFPTDGPLTPELRTSARDLFLKLQAALTEAVK